MNPSISPKGASIMGDPEIESPEEVKQASSLSDMETFNLVASNNWRHLLVKLSARELNFDENAIP